MNPFLNSRKTGAPRPLSNTASFDLASQLLVAWYILNFVQGVLTRNLIQNHVEPLDKEVRKLTPSHVLDNLNKYLSLFKDKSGK